MTLDFEKAVSPSVWQASRSELKYLDYQCFPCRMSDGGNTEVKKLREIVVEVWGDFACFTQPYTKVERLTYSFPTPSAARRILSAIYSKPKEFYYQVNRIEVLNPISFVSFKCNEVKSRISSNLIDAEEDRTQRMTVALRDVRYRIASSIVPRPSFTGKEEQLYEQALRRIRTGKTYFQPSMGLRQFPAYFEESDGKTPPIDVNMDAGLMVYDVFDLHDDSVSKKAKPKLSLFHAVMEHGVVQIPPYDSAEVLKGAEVC